MALLSVVACGMPSCRAPKKSCHGCLATCEVVVARLDGLCAAHRIRTAVVAPELMTSLWHALQQLWLGAFRRRANAGEFPPVPRPAAPDRRSRRPASAGRYPPYRDAGGPGQDGALLPQRDRLRHAGGLRHHPLARARHHGARLRDLSRDRGQAAAGDRQADPAQIPSRPRRPAKWSCSATTSISTSCRSRCRRSTTAAR